MKKTNKDNQVVINYFILPPRETQREMVERCVKDAMRQKGFYIK